MFDLKHIFAEMSLLSKGIASVLLIMAIMSVAVVIERVIALSRGSSETKKFAKGAIPLMESWDFAKLIALSDRHTLSPLARLVGPTVRRFTRGVDDDGKLSAVELARREAARQQEAIGAELRRGMSILATVGSIAPFVGLLGTVVGIITAFQGIAATGSGGLGAVSAGIAEALIETAFGLMVAIPAVLFYNFLNTRIAAVEMTLGRSAGELLDEMENEHGSRDSGKFGRQEVAA
jgi:biopolymer transport protein ExbB